MKHIETIAIKGNINRKIELYQGDITSLQPEEAFDVLVISAYPNEYSPVSGSLIGALFQKGVSVQSLAYNKAEDLRESFSCWLSHEIENKKNDLQFKRILCFEPFKRGSPPEVVGEIFQALFPIVGSYENINTVALPILASGVQNYSVKEILEPLLETAIHWMEHGLPLDTIRIFTYSDEDTKEAISIFSQKHSVQEQDFSDLLDKPFGAPSNSTKEPLRDDSFEEIDNDDPFFSDQQKPSQQWLGGPTSYDIFLSYAREESKFVDRLIDMLLQLKPDIRLFLDRKDLDVGMPWQPEIFESLDYSHLIVTVFSPSYLESKVCKEEFNIAWMISRESENDDILFPMYLFTANLPTYMKYRGYIDCREGDESKLKDVANTLLRYLKKKSTSVMK